MHGYDEDKAKVIARLRRIEGQVRAITQMVEDDKYCILTCCRSMAWPMWAIFPPRTG